MSNIKFTITPAEVLDHRGMKYKRSRGWLSVLECPHCGGGKDRQRFTYAVHARDGNFHCLRTSCGEKGSFWKLLELSGYNPRDYIDRGVSQKPQKKMYVYGARK